MPPRFRLRCVTGDNSVVLADDDDKVEQNPNPNPDPGPNPNPNLNQVEQALVQITSLFPELCQQLRLPYMV